MSEKYQRDLRLSLDANDDLNIEGEFSPQNGGFFWGGGDDEVNMLNLISKEKLKEVREGIEQGKFKDFNVNINGNNIFHLLMNYKLSDKSDIVEYIKILNLLKAKKMEIVDAINKKNSAKM